MFVRINQSATAEQIAAIRSRATAAGLAVYDEPSVRGLTLALLGPKGFDETLRDEFVGMPGVASVARPSRAYRLSSQEFRKEPTIVKVRDAVIGGGPLTLMAGPCSIESREQLFEVASGVAAAGATLLRGGAFKPRTSPYAFQGLGLEGLRLLAEARERTGLPIITEVMEPAQVDMVAEFADVLQIGTRNMQNFSLLNAVGRTRMPVMLKRGLSGTIEEWLLAAEYILAAGNRQVILCERGIRTFETAARNTLDLNAVPILRQLTHLPVIVDPSHATGKRWMVAPMSYAGVAAGADGIMVEVHPKPEEAWSDGEQSLTLPMFSRLAGELRTIHSVVSPMHANPGEASER
ncbi:MAG: putative phospho-2-dehydro-3-deoxyheptonate aldolase [Chloroflexota bacterium]|jgi:3-deoxy-7-phosphoheptulonate synthase